MIIFPLNLKKLSNTILLVSCVVIAAVYHVELLRALQSSQCVSSFYRLAWKSFSHGAKKCKLNNVILLSLCLQDLVFIPKKQQRIQGSFLLFLFKRKCSWFSLSFSFLVQNYFLTSVPLNSLDFIQSSLLPLTQRINLYRVTAQLL